MKWYRRGVVVLSVATLGVGVALLARTAAEGGPVTAFVIGGLLVLLGAARLVLNRRSG